MSMSAAVMPPQGELDMIAPPPAAATEEAMTAWIKEALKKTTLLLCVNKSEGGEEFIRKQTMGLHMQIQHTLSEKMPKGWPSTFEQDKVMAVVEATVKLECTVLKAVKQTHISGVPLILAKWWANNLSIVGVEHFSSVECDGVCTAQ